MTIDGGRDDRSLLAAHVNGDADAFGSLVRRHRDRMWALAIRTLGDREEAADAVQEAFISALRGADSFRGDSEVSTWLHRIVINACLDRMRRRKARPTVPLDGHELRARSDDYAAAMARLDLRTALERLPDAQRMALTLIDIEDMPVAEAARILGVAEGTVKSRCARGRMALASALRSGYDLIAQDAGGNQDGAPGVTAGEGTADAAGSAGSADEAFRGR